VRGRRAWSAIAERCRRFFRKGDAVRSYPIGGVEISLPPGHALPRYQAEHPLYDRFPLVLGKLEMEGWIVDIGANVGDTAAALAAGENKRILCVEPAEEFYRILVKNVDRLRQAGSTVRCVRSAVGDDGGTVRLESSRGTAAIAREGERVSQRSLDRIIAENLPESASVSLIKCDVDGCDPEALRSGERTISDMEPLLYFEAEVRQRERLRAFTDLCQWLDALGYHRFTLFDNFGALLAESAPLEVVQDALRYTWIQNSHVSTRTIWYFDVLTSTQKMRREHEWAVRGYRRTYLEG
jgi:FkbM family methyltransferase